MTCDQNVAPTRMIVLCTHRADTCWPELWDTSAPRQHWLTLFLAVFLILTNQLFNLAEDWPGWRGPRGDGTSLEAQVPTQWNGDTALNLAWKSEVPGSGHASPIIWRDRVFLAACADEKQERVLACYERTTGKLLWRRAVIRSPLETKHALNSFASSTPATDGQLVYVSFLEVDGHTIPAPNVGTPRPITPGHMVVAAYDFDGHQKWLVRPGEFISAHGYCASPLLYKRSEKRRVGQVRRCGRSA